MDILTQEANQKIAEFLGMGNNPNSYNLLSNNLTVIDRTKTTCTAEELRFNLSWDWLMKVVEKIESLSYRKGRHFFLHKDSAYVQIKVDRMNVDLFGKWGTSANTDTFNAIYRAVLEFIEKKNVIL